MTIPRDKLQHALVSATATYLGTAACAVLGWPLWWAPVAVLVVGAGREACQYLTAKVLALESFARRWNVLAWYAIGQAEWMDMAANVVGVALVLALGRWVL